MTDTPELIALYRRCTAQDRAAFAELFQHSAPTQIPAPPSGPSGRSCRKRSGARWSDCRRIIGRSWFYVITAN
ncbi:MAG: hypothetical protein LC793_10765 [Thermomicrobia bacterium]|nr:hypothetical protein [Thermomicrobia bacterium]